MPRLTRAQKYARKAKAEALKASEASTNGANNENTASTSNPSACDTSSHLVASEVETRVLTAGESKHENVTKSNASEVVQDKRSEKNAAEIGKDRADGGERGPGEHKHQKVIEVDAFPVAQGKIAEISRAEIAKERSGGGERGPGEDKHQKVTEGNTFTTVQNKIAEKVTAEIPKERSGRAERGPSGKSVEEESVSLLLSQLESKQKQREERSSFAGNKGFRQDFNGRNSTASQNYGGHNSRQGGQHVYYENRSSDGGGYNESDSRRIDALGRVLVPMARTRGVCGRRGGNAATSTPEQNPNEQAENGIEMLINLLTEQRDQIHNLQQTVNDLSNRQEQLENIMESLERNEEHHHHRAEREISPLYHISRILRHQAPELRLKVRSDGYVVVKDLLSLSTKTQAGLPLHTHSVDDIKKAVDRDNKQRFGLREENGQLLIRANQGHSLQMINSEALLKPVLSAEEVPICVHGTYKKNLESIKKEGLKCMNRNHVHFAAGQFKEDGVISGMRGDSEVFR